MFQRGYSDENILCLACNGESFYEPQKIKKQLKQFLERMIKQIQFHVSETRTRKEVNKFMTLADIVNKIQNGDAYTAFIEAFRAEEKICHYMKPFKMEESVFYGMQVLFFLKALIKM